jgi:hypothetical protein
MGKAEDINSALFVFYEVEALTAGSHWNVTQSSLLNNRTISANLYG